MICTCMVVYCYVLYMGLFCIHGALGLTGNRQDASTLALFIKNGFSIIANRKCFNFKGWECFVVADDPLLQH